MFKKISNFIKEYRAQSVNSKLGRILIGEDRFGNQYFQHINAKNQLTRRSIELNPKNPESELDPLWDDWLRHRRKDPYTKEELDKIIEQEEIHKINAYEYEKNDYEMMKNFRKDYKMERESPKTSHIESNESEYKPGVWKPPNK